MCNNCNCNSNLDRISGLSSQVTKLFNENYQKDEIIKELTESKKALHEKYEICKVVNIDIFTKLEKYRKGTQNFAVYFKNNCEIKDKLSKQKHNLETEVKSLTCQLQNSHALFQKLQTDLNSERNNFQEFWQKSIDEKNRFRAEYQGIIDGLKEENNVLMNSNQELINKINVFTNTDTSNKKEKIKELRQTVKEQDHRIKEMTEKHGSIEKRLRQRLSSLKNICINLKQQNDFDKREAEADKQRTIASKAVHSNAIKKMSKFCIDNNEEVFTAIRLIMDKMCENSSKRILDKTAKTMIKMKNDENTSLKNISREISDQRNGEKITVRFVEQDSPARNHWLLAPSSEHSFNLKDQDNGEIEC